MNLTSRIRSVIAAARVNPTERYLNEATSIADLEKREREIDAGRFSARRYR